MKYNIVIVGAGTSGCIASQKLASKGYKVCLIDRKPNNLIGKKICGDGVGRHEFREAEVALPRSVEREINGIEFIVDQVPAFKVVGAGYTLNRLRFGQELLMRALNSGAQLIDNFQVREIILNRGGILSVKGFDKNNRKSVIFAEVFLDSSGINGVVKGLIPDDWPVNEPIEKHEIGIGYRETCYLKKSLTEYCRLYYDWELAPGGYCWIIPKRGVKVNAGILMPISLTDSKALIDRFNIFKKNLGVFRDSASNKGIGFVPLKTPLKCPSWRNLLVAGDAAFLANPLNGGGIGPAMRSASLAAEAVNDALQKGKPMEKSLWVYNINIAQEFGFKYAVCNVLKEHLIRSKPVDVNEFFKALGIKKTYRSSSFLNELSKTQYLFLIAKLLKHPKMLFTLFRVMKEMKQLSFQYSSYPLTHQSYRQWVKRFYDKLFST